MGEFDTLTALFGDRFDRLEFKLDAYLASQEALSRKVAVLEERQSSLSSQFKGVLGAIGTAMVACAGLIVKFWH